MADYGLVADVGGTNIRLALVELSTGSVSAIEKFLCANYAAISDVISGYLANHEQNVKQACIAIACPTDDDWIAMTNHSWAFSKRELKQQLGLDSLYVINDFTAIAMSIPTLEETQKIQVHAGQAQAGAPIAVYGPGTGLGVSHLVQHNGEYICLPGEGGHVEFAPANERQTKVLLALQKEFFGHVSAERLLSGPGLVNIYRALATIEGIEAEDFEPADVTQRGLDESCPLCKEALAMFCSALGAFGGNLALNLSSFGGVYIAGGIISRFMDYFKSSEFNHYFEDKGRFKDFVSKVPVYVITEEQPGLQGASAYLRQANGYRI